MTGIEKAKHLFQEAGLAFPTIPEEFAPRFKERGSWVFSTRKLEESPYVLDHYVEEAEKNPVKDYIAIAHSGHGVNSYAIQYYLVQGALQMFLHLDWGGVYSDAEKDAAKIKDCFSLADKIVSTAHATAKLRRGDRLTVVGSDFYGSYWLKPGEHRHERRDDSKTPADVLAEVLHWLTENHRNQM